jgi:hypothetical protein
VTGVDDDTDAVPGEPADTDAPVVDEPESPDTDDEPWERPVDRFKRSAAGSVLAAGLLGFRDALEGRPEKEEPAIVSEAPEPKLDHIDIVLDPEHPERSRAIVFLPPRDDASEPDEG